MNKIDLNRRNFLITASAVGGGLAIGFAALDSEASTPPMSGPWGTDTTNPEITAWLSIAPDNTVTVRSAMTEIGNGAMTQTAMTIAEELHVDWSKVKVEFAAPARNFKEDGVYNKVGGRNGFFSGRSTNEGNIKGGLQVGASARVRLQTAAAAEWKVPVTDVVAHNGMLTHKASGRSMTYGQIAAKAAKVKLDVEPTPKPRSEWTLLGKESLGKLNNAAIADGSAVYGMDVRLPGMLYAALKQSPVHGGKLKSFDASVVMKMPGVVAVVAVDPAKTPGTVDVSKVPFGKFGMEDSRAQHAVAVVAEHYWQARKALDALPVVWDDGDGAKWKTTEQVYDTALKTVAKTGGKVEIDVGDISVLDKQPKIVEATYLTPYSEHACMEPLNGTALVTPDKVEIWHPSQNSEQAFWVAADEAGVPPEKVVYNQTYVGGAFGRRVFGNDVRMVVAVARQVPGRPVHVVWSREETTRQGRYRPLFACKMRAGLDKDGNPQAISSNLAACKAPPTIGQTNGMKNTPYLVAGGIPNVRMEIQDLPLHIMIGPYRGPAYNALAFMTETFIDEMAVAAGKDPLEYRLSLLASYPDQGWTKCLKEAASKAGWGSALPKGMGRGIAISNWPGSGKPHQGTTVCTVATVEVTKAGALKVHSLDVAFDTGKILNKDAVHTQLEGGAIFGYNMAMHEELHVKDGRIVEGNYDRYPIARAGEVPKVNIHFGGLTDHDRFGEIGEPPVGTVGPAIGNAIFAATGKRVRTQPFRTLDLSWS